MPVVERDLAAQIQDILSDRDDLSTVILHGSAAAGRQRADSDIDLVVAGAQALDPAQLLELDRVLGPALGREIDLRDLRRIEGLYLRRVLTTGRILRARDPSLLGRRACDAMDWASDMLPAIRSGTRRYLDAVERGDHAA